MDQLLPPRLGALLALEPDTGFAHRLTRVHEAAARSIGKLGDLDLVKYEDSEIDGTADLSLWEEVAPVVGSTIADVNALLNEIAACFPQGQVLVDGRQTSVMGVIQQAAFELREEVTHFGTRVRDPAVVGDRWNLLTELQAFRFLFRERIGELVFQSASVLGEVRRSEVEPGYDQALASTLVVRATTADLRRLMHSRIHRVAESQPEEMAPHVQQMEKELNAFGRTAAWRALRAQDKRVILEFRAKLKALPEGPVHKMDVLALLEPFVEFVDGFEAINDREILQHHDQEVQAQVGVLLERAMNALSEGDLQEAFNEAVGQGQTLYGRNAEFDTFLRKLRKTSPGRETVQAEVDQFLTLLASLS